MFWDIFLISFILFLECAGIGLEMKRNYLTKRQIRKIKKKARKYKKLFDKITKVLNEKK